MDWKECREKRFVKEIAVDTELIASLLMSAKKRSKTAERLEIDETTASTVVTLHYDSLRELLEALVILKGFKVYNHDCYCAFLKEQLSEIKMSVQFDRFRKVRNKINYYGTDIDMDSAKELVSGIKTLTSAVKRLLR